MYNHFSLIYCDLNGNLIGFVLIVLVEIYLIFVFTGHAVEGYIGPSITFMSNDWLKLSEAMGAVTLLSLANGAGDVITAIVAGGSSDGISYNIGSLFGSGFFVCTIVIAITIFKSKT